MRTTILNKKTTHHGNFITHPNQQKANTMHYYGFHIKDYRARTAHLTPLEHYIYRTLIDWYYLNEKPFSSVEEIARYLLLPLTDENTQAINNVLDEFFNHHKGKYHHTRINQEIKNFKAGKYTLDNNTTANANANQKKGNGAGNETVTENHEASNGKSHAEITPSHETDNGTGNGADNETVTQNHGKNDAITINHKPLTNNQLINKPPKAPLGDTTAKTGKTDQHNQASQDIFDFWLDIMDKDPAKWKLTDERKRKIIARLKDGKDITDIKQAIYNASQDNWAVTHGKTDISYICQSDARLSEFLLKQPKAMQHRQQQNQFTGANHATHQPTNKQPTTAEYADKLNTALSQYLEQRKRTQRPANHGDWSTICPVETVV